MWDLQDIGFVQWNTHGDHPDVQAFSDPQYKLGRLCKLCGRPYTEHGLIKNDDYPIATSYDHFHGKNALTVCPTDYIYQTVNDKGIKQTVVLPEKMLHRINDSIGISYKERIIDTGITEIIKREHYSRHFILKSDLLEITNTDFKHVSDNYEIFLDIEYKLTTPLATETITTYNLETVDYSHTTKKYLLKSEEDIVLDSSQRVRVVNSLSVGGHFYYGGNEFTDILAAQKTEITEETDDKIDVVKESVSDLETSIKDAAEASKTELEDKLNALETRVVELEAIVEVLSSSGSTP